MRARRTRAFTLVEVMIAVAILATVTTLCWGSFKNTLRTKAAVEAQAGRYRTVRIALERMARDMSMAYLSQNEDSTQQERRTFFVGKRKTDVDEVRFSYFGHQRLYQDANESDTAQVLYYGVRDRDDARKISLVRRETRRLSNLRADDAPGEGDLVCDDVVRLQVDYFDAREKTWREDWGTISADGQPDRLPSKVRIVLTVHDERGQAVPFSTEARVTMQEALNLKANDLSPPGVGSTNPNGGNQGGGNAGGGNAGGGNAGGGNAGGGNAGGGNPGGIPGGAVPGGAASIPPPNR